MKIVKNILKVCCILLLVGYVGSLYHVVYVDRERKKDSFIKNIGNAFVLLYVVIVMVISLTFVSIKQYI